MDAWKTGKGSNPFHPNSIILCIKSTLQTLSSLRFMFVDSILAPLSPICRLALISIYVLKFSTLRPLSFAKWPAPTEPILLLLFKLSSWRLTSWERKPTPISPTILLYNFSILRLLIFAISLQLSSLTLFGLYSLFKLSSTNYGN